MTSANPASNVVPLNKPAEAEKRRTDKWPKTVLARGYSQIPTILFWGQAKLDLTPDEFNVLLQIVSHWWIEGANPFLAKETLAQRVGKHPRTVQKHITSLEKKGFISRISRYRKGKGQDANGFDLTGLNEKLKAIAPEFEKVAEQNRLRRRKVEKVAQ